MMLSQNNTGNGVNSGVVASSCKMGSHTSPRTYTHPSVKQVASVFIDGQNLHHSLREAFGANYPNYDPRKLAEEICRERGYELGTIRFYTGVENRDRNEFWHDFWKNKIEAMKRDGVLTYTRPLQYRKIRDRVDPSREFFAPMEKGVDIRIALDIVNELNERKSNVVVLFSQDSDFCEISDEIRRIASTQKRWIRFVSAFPKCEGTRGINGSEWYAFTPDFYRKCIDPQDYRPGHKS